MRGRVSQEGAPQPGSPALAWQQQGGAANTQAAPLPARTVLRQKLWCDSVQMRDQLERV